MTFTDYPKAAKENAKRALKFRAETENKNGCGTAVGWARANQLAKGEPISIDTVKRMASFNRHRKNKDVPYEEGCGGLMWDAWGGTEGVDWAIKKSEQIDKEMKQKALYEYNLLNDVFDTGQEVEALSEMLNEANGDKVTINVASDGGEVFLGLKLAGLISAYPGETVANVYGLAASIATIVALSADKVLINKFAFFMIHNSWGDMRGNKEEIRKQAKTLKDIDALLANIYLDKIRSNNKLINNSEEETLAKIKTMMANETFVPATQALEMGLVDGYIEEPINEYEQIGFANAQNKAIFYNSFPKRFNKMKEKTNLFAAILAALVGAFGFNKEETLDAVKNVDALASLDEPEQPANAKSDEKMKEKEEEEESKEMKLAKEMKEKMEKMEEEIKQLKEEKEEMAKQLEKEKKANAELQASVEEVSSFATPSGDAKNSIKKDSMFSPETQVMLNSMLNRAFKK